MTGRHDAGEADRAEALGTLDTLDTVDTVDTLDTLELRGVRGRGRHGVLPAETELGQEFSADVVLHLDTRPAAASDDLAGAVDYADLADRVHAVLTGPPVRLLETLAQRVADACLADARVARVDVAVHKPAAPLAVPFDDVVVRVTRHRPAPAEEAG